MREFNHNPTEPELTDVQNHDQMEKENVNKTGTTTIGLETEDGVVIATDRRASLGGKFVTNKSVVKVEQIHESAAMTLVGSVGGAQSFIRNLRSESNLYETRRGREMSIKSLATLAGNFARAGPFMAINPIVGGVDNDGSHVYSIDPAGGVMQDEYTVTGSGTQVAYGRLEQNYNRDMSLVEARKLAASAVESAAERDTGSGNGLAVADITEDNVEIQTFPEFPDPSELAELKDFI